ncbi:MAG: PadR family transcriptional regulator [Anaerolineaceae bacterium]
MSLRLSLLGMLNNHSMTGYDLKKMADVSIAKFREAQTSQVYRELNYMEEIGWLTSVIEIQTEKPNKRIYSITPAGRQVFLDWLTESPLDEEKLNISVFLMKTFFAGDRSVVQNLEIFKQFRQSCTIKLASVEASFAELAEFQNKFPEHQNYAFYWDFTSNFETALYKMCIGWADQCIKAIETRSAS